MNKVLLSAVAALTLSAGSAFAADLPVKARPIAAPPPPAWDVAVGAIIMSDYNFRGISQSNRGPSVGAYFEPQYTTSIGTLYVGIGALGIDWPTSFGFSSPSAEVDFYGGWRNTWGKFTADIGALYYYYPKEQLNINSDFFEVYGKFGYAFTPDFSVVTGVFYTPDLLNYGAIFGPAGGPDAEAVYLSFGAKWVTPWKAGDFGSFISGDVGHWFIENNGFALLGLVDPSYTYWNVGLGITYKALTLDLRYHGTDTNRTSCGSFLLVGAANPAARWCGDTFIAGLKFDTTINALK